MTHTCGTHLPWCETGVGALTNTFQWASPPWNDFNYGVFEVSRKPGKDGYEYSILMESRGIGKTGLTKEIQLKDL